MFAEEEEVVTEALNNILYRLPMEDKIKIAQQPEQLIKRCRFNSKYNHEVSHMIY